MARQLEDWLKAYLQFTAYSEAPDLFQFWSGVATVAGALRRKVRFDQEIYVWTPNFYIILVAPPGIATKSTTMNYALDLLRDIKGIRFGPDVITWQQLIKSLAGATEMVLMPDGLYYTMSCLTFASSELGSLLDPQDRKMLTILTDLWDGHTRIFEKETKTSGSDAAPNPWINIIACTTPDWLADNMPKAIIGGGFTSRCVFVYADKKRRLIPYPKSHRPPDMKDLKKCLLHDLEMIAMLKGDFELTPEAEKFGEEWYNKHWLSPNRALSQNRQFIGYLSRKQGHIHKLAMVLSAAQRNDLTITKQQLENAVKITDAVERDISKVFRAINTADGLMEHADEILQTIRFSGKNGLGRNDLYAGYYTRLSNKEFGEIVSSLIEAGLVVQRQLSDTLTLFSTDKLSRSPDKDSDTFVSLEDLARGGSDF